MIQIFNHYVPGRAIILAAIETLFILIAIYLSLVLQFVDPIEAISVVGIRGPVSPYTFAFTLGMIVVLSSLADRL